MYYQSSVREKNWRIIKSNFPIKLKLIGIYRKSQDLDEIDLKINYQIFTFWHSKMDHWTSETQKSLEFRTKIIYFLYISQNEKI